MRGWSSVSVRGVGRDGETSVQTRSDPAPEPSRILNAPPAPASGQEISNLHRGSAAVGTRQGP